MIQRIQSLLLFLAIGATVAALFVPSWQFSYQNNSEAITGWTVEATQADEAKTLLFTSHGETTRLVSHAAFVVFSGIGVLMLLITIFGYQNRLRQIRFAYTSIFNSDACPARGNLIQPSGTKFPSARRKQSTLCWILFATACHSPYLDRNRSHQKRRRG